MDIIIGGHSHTILEKPHRVNDILIAQAGVGTDQIGRFDIVVDDDTNSIIDYSWQLIPIDDNLTEPDEKLQEYIESFKDVVDRKYNTIIGKLARELTHPKREEETSLGNLVADAFAEVAESDVMLVGSGSIRSKKLGPVVTLKDLLSCFPFDDVLTRYTVSGEKLKEIFFHVMRTENRNSEGECYQVNGRVKAVYDDNAHKLVDLTIDDQSVSDTDSYTLCLQGFHFINSDAYLNVSNEELLELKGSKVVSTSAKEVLEEYLRNHQNISKIVEGRLVYR